LQKLPDNPAKPGKGLLKWLHCLVDAEKAKNIIILLQMTDAAVCTAILIRQHNKWLGC